MSLRELCRQPYLRTYMEDTPAENSHHSKVSWFVDGNVFQVACFLSSVAARKIRAPPFSMTGIPSSSLQAPHFCSSPTSECLRGDYSARTEHLQVRLVLLELEILYFSAHVGQLDLDTWKSAGP